MLKNTIFFTLLILTSTAFAIPYIGAKCPSGTRTVYSCQRASEIKDSHLPGEHVDTLAICEVRNSYSMVIEKDQLIDRYFARLVARPGANSYQAVVKNGQITLSVPILPQKPIKSRLYFNVPTHSGMKGETTFSCR